MPKENIERAIAKGAGSEGAAVEKITYELYGPGGTALIIDTLTDNRNRTVQELKHLVSKLGYTLAEPGSAAWAFSAKDGELVPTTTIPLSDDDADRLAALVDAIEEHDDVQAVYTNAE
jgi:transcriptional/translational regulatory protein YebC/TACO1